ncbi:unnamed protein product, partial [Linum tenue]
ASDLSLSVSTLTEKFPCFLSPIPIGSRPPPNQIPAIMAEANANPATPAPLTKEEDARAAVRVAERKTRMPPPFPFSSAEFD